MFLNLCFGLFFFNMFFLSRRYCKVVAIQKVTGNLKSTIATAWFFEGELEALRWKKCEMEKLCYI